MKKIWIIAFLSSTLFSCRHGEAPWEQKELDHTSIKEVISQPTSPAIVPPKPAFNPKTIVPDQKEQSTQQIDAAFKQKISLSLTEQVSLKQALPELTRQTGVNLQLAPDLDQKIIFHAKDTPLIDVLSQLCELIGLRYKIMGKTVRIEKDTPYSHNYNVQFLNLTRKTENRVSIATDVFSQTRKGGQLVGDNGSNSAVNMNNESNFWNELQQSLGTLLGQSSATFSMHKQAGLITVNASEKQHRLVRQYLKQLKQMVATQVLIEAKVVEVSLSDQYRSGVNWQKVAHGDLRFSMPFGNIAQGPRFGNAANAPENLVSFGAAGKTFSSLLLALEEFGATRTLSSPRLTVINNQTAILKVAQNEVYFRLNYNRQYNTNVNRESFNVSSDIQTVPIGFVMSVQPSIDPETGEIILSLRPTVSRMTRAVRDPAVDIAYNANNTTSTNATTPRPSLVPVVEVREIDSILRLKNDEIGILGGLMEVRSHQNRSQIPGVGNVPVLGELVKGRADGDEVVELVILLKATIVEGAPAPDNADDRIYHEYTNDPRPF